MNQSEERGARALASWRDRGGDPGALPETVRNKLAAILAASDFVLDSSIRDPRLLIDLANDGSDIDVSS